MTKYAIIGGYYGAEPETCKVVALTETHAEAMAMLMAEPEEGSLMEIGEFHFYFIEEC